MKKRGRSRGGRDRPQRTRFWGEGARRRPGAQTSVLFRSREVNVRERWQIAFLELPQPVRHCCDKTGTNAGRAWHLTASSPYCGRCLTPGRLLKLLMKLAPGISWNSEINMHGHAQGARRR
jgi:hypothetical protein